MTEIDAGQLELGKPTKRSGIAVIAEEPGSTEDRVAFLEAKVQMLMDTIGSPQREERPQSAEGLNVDGLPLGISLIGTSQKSGISVMTVHADGYYLGLNRYDSLSAAAEEASGVRRSGWTFWKLPDGRTVKEAFGRI